MGGEVLEPILDFRTERGLISYTAYPLAAILLLFYLLLFFSEPGKVAEVDAKKFTAEEKL